MSINNILHEISENVESGEIDNEGLVQIIELAGAFLNLVTIPTYAKQNKLSYNGVKNFRRVVKIFGVKFVIDNP